MENEFLISVIIPAWNRCGLLERAVASALGQTLADVEVLIVDDGSTDGTEARWSREPDPRIRYIRQEHGGACRARNRGLAEARGEYAAFLDSDDTWVRDKLEKQKAFLEQTGAEIVFCAFRHIDGNGRVTVRPGERFQAGQIRKEQLLAENAVSTQTIFGKTECLREVGFDEAFPRLQDWDFALRMAGKYRVYYDPTPMADVYLQGDSISGDPSKAFRAIRMIHDKNIGDYARNFEASMALMTAYYEFGSAAGEDCANNCLLLMNLGRSLRENGAILARTGWLRWKQARSGCLKKKQP